MNFSQKKNIKCLVNSTIFPSSIWWMTYDGNIAAAREFVEEIA